MDFKLKYEKETLIDLAVTHIPCEWCNRDSSIKKEVEKMLSSLDLTIKIDHDLAWMYHMIVHMTTTQARSLLLWADSEKLVWLYELTRCIDDEHSHELHIRKMIEDTMSERYLCIFIKQCMNLKFHFNLWIRQTTLHRFLFFLLVLCIVSLWIFPVISSFILNESKWINQVDF